MSGINIKNQGLRDAFNGMLDDNKITKAEVQKLIDQANKDGLLSSTEKGDLANILQRVGDKFDADAKQLMRGFLGMAPEGSSQTPVDPTPVDPSGGIKNPASSRVSGLTDLTTVADTFAAEIKERAAEFNTPEKAMSLFAEYAGKLKALGKDQDARKVDVEVEKLLIAGRNSPARGYDLKDTDHDTLSDLREVAMGRDPHTFEPRVMGPDQPVWTTTYWPSAGHGDVDQPGNPTENLWAKDGPLAKLDKLLVARGMANRAKALEFERKPLLKWLVGEDYSAGQFVPQALLKEEDAESTTGVDFDGDGKLTPGTKVDFLDANRVMLSVSSRNQLIPKLGDERLTRKQVVDGEGNRSFEFFKADGTKLTPEQAKGVFYAHPDSDGKADGTLNIDWWGFCDQVSLAGILFKEPMKPEVTIDGVKFTKQDMLGLLTVIANSQATYSEFAGYRYDGDADVLVTKDGKTYYGKLLTDVEFRTKEMTREADTMILTKVDKDIKFRTLDGKDLDVKAADVKQLTREDNWELAPAEFHTTILKWLGEDKRPAVMDYSAGRDVWNYNFWRATLRSAQELTGLNLPKEPGHNGPVNPANKVVQYEMELAVTDPLIGSPRYRYWLEQDQTGRIVNGGWVGRMPPDFLWRPANLPTFTGYNERNPFVDPKLVKEIYDKFMAP